MELSKLKNIGPKTEKWFSEIGISSVEKLKKTPLDKIYYQLKEKGFPVNMNLVYALDAGLKDEHWLSLTEERKEELKALIANSKYMGPEDCMKSLQSLRNIGKQMALYLYDSGITSPAQFKSMTFEKIWAKLLKTHPKVGTHPGYKIAVLGALRDEDWNAVDLNA